MLITIKESYWHNRIMYIKWTNDTYSMYIDLGQHFKIDKKEYDSYKIKRRKIMSIIRNSRIWYWYTFLVTRGGK